MFAVLRFSKFKSFSHISQASSHNDRSRETPNADPARGYLNQVLVGSGDAVSDVRQALAAVGIQKLRKNGVLAVEAVLSASPSFFNEQPERLAFWVDRSVAWLRKEHGENLVSAWLHLDEQTPHIHAVVVPIDRSERKKGSRARLNAARWFSGREKLSEAQSSYAHAVADFGIERGKSKALRGADHKTVRQYYAEAEAFQVGVEAFERGAIVDALSCPTSPHDIPGGAQGRALRPSPKLSEPERRGLANAVRPAFDRVWSYARAQLDALKDAARLAGALRRARKAIEAEELESAARQRQLGRARRWMQR
jgi:hypothetical protein